MPVKLEDVRREIHIALQNLKVLLPPAESTGDVDGPASAVDGNLAVFDGVTGKLIKDGGSPTAIYTGGDGIDITGSTVAVDLSTSSGLFFSAAKLQVKTALEGVKIDGSGNLVTITSPVLGGIGLISGGVIAIDQLDLLPSLLNGIPNEDMFVAVWDRTGGGGGAGIIGQLSLNVLAPVPNNAAKTLVGADLMSFWSDADSEMGQMSATAFFAEAEQFIDHGGLAGLADIADHAGYLDLGGTRPMTGAIDLDGNVLTLDGDGDTSVGSPLDDVIEFKTGGVLRMQVTNTLLSMIVPIDVALSSIRFAALTDITGSANNMDFQVNGSDRMNILDTQLTVSVPIVMSGGDRIDLEPLGKCSIREDGLDIIMEAQQIDMARFSGAIFTLGDGVNAFLIRLKDEAAGNAQDFTISGAKGGANSDGGKLILKPGDGQGVAADGTLEIQTSNGTARITVAAGGLLTLNTMLIGTTGNLAGVPSIGIDDGGFIGIDSGDKITWNNNVSCVVRVNSVDALTITDTELDGNSVLRITDFAGMRSTFTFGWPSANTALARNMYTMGQAAHGSNDGYVMPRAGSIVSVTGHMDLNAIVSANIEMRVNKNGSYPGANAVLVAPGVANGHKWTQTFAVGTHTFVAGDLLGGTRYRDGTSATTDDMNMVMEVEWDN